MKTIDYVIEYIKEDNPLAGYFIVSLIVLSMGSSFFRLMSWILLLLQRRRINRDLNPIFTKQEILIATKYYVSSNAQDELPSEYDSQEDDNSRKYKLIPLFINEILKNAAVDKRHHIIFADTGMGKTTFLLNLYIAYKNKITLLREDKLAIEFVPLGDPTAIERISCINNKIRTILLLDAFDEDIHAINNSHERLLEVMKASRDFKYVIMTCRTHFFPSEIEQPTKTGIIGFGVMNKEYEFSKYYLSLFDESDVNQYLLKRHQSPGSEEYQQAKRIVRQSPNIASRPFLLYNIDELVQSGKKFEYSYQVYNVIVDSWIQREGEKSYNVLRGVNVKSYKESLYQFSMSLALDMYQNRHERGGYFIHKDELTDYGSGIEIGDLEYHMSASDKRARSLLIRNSSGQYRFSHKSILEYFLAIRCLENYEFLISFDFDGMSAAKRFISEMCCEKLQKIKGHFNTVTTKVKTPFQQMTIDDYLELTKVWPVDLKITLPLLELAPQGQLTISLDYINDIPEKIILSAALNDNY